MAAIPTSLVKELDKASDPTRRSSSSSRPAALSHGRGGAGNIGYSSTDVEPESLETPHLTAQMYTTGRGGTGNMAKNTDAGEARRAQDVVAHPRRDSFSKTHIGRGGAANVYTPTTHDDVARAEKEDTNQEENDAESHPGLAEKGKQWLMSKVHGGKP